MAPGIPPVVVTFTNGLKVETLDKDWSFKIGGRIFVDGGASSQPFNGKSGNVGIRRARLEVEGRAAKVWFYKLQYDFAGNAPNTTVFTPIGIAGCVAGPPARRRQLRRRQYHDASQDTAASAASATSISARTRRS